MDLERRQGDRAHLDKTFRAAHSLKGAAAMVGLATLAEFTHGIEAVLDRIRSGSLAVDSDIITTLLEARDHLAAMVEAEAAQSPIPPSTELTQRLIALLRELGLRRYAATRRRQLLRPRPARRRRHPPRNPRQGRTGPRSPPPPAAASPRPRAEGPEGRRRGRLGIGRETSSPTEEGPKMGPAAGLRPASSESERPRKARPARGPPTSTGSPWRPDRIPSDGASIPWVSSTSCASWARPGSRPIPGRPAARRSRSRALLPELDDHLSMASPIRTSSTRSSSSSPKTARSRSSGGPKTEAGRRPEGRANHRGLGRRRDRPGSRPRPGRQDAAAAPDARPKRSSRRLLDSSAPALATSATPPATGPRPVVTPAAAAPRRARFHGPTRASGSTPPSSTTWSAWPANWPCCRTT